MTEPGWGERSKRNDDVFIRNHSDCRSGIYGRSAVRKLGAGTEGDPQTESKKSKGRTDGNTESKENAVFRHCQDGCTGCRKMKSSECFGYDLKPEYTRTRTGSIIKLAREECKALWTMQCRKNKEDAESVCNFAKTRKQFEADRLRSEKIYNERRKKFGKAGEHRD